MTCRRTTDYRQLARFGLVGIATYALAIGAFRLLHDVWNVDRLISATAAYAVAVAFHFTANKLFTFANKDASLQRQIVRYLLVCGTNYLLSMVCLELLVKQCHVPATLAFGLSVATTTGFGFAALRFWVFSKK